MANFTLDMSRFANKSEKEIQLYIKKTILDLTTSIIKDTPRDTSRAASNWFVSFENSTDKTTKDTNPTKAIADATTTIATNKIGKYIYIQNNLPYIVGLEYGKSKQAAQGMVRINVERFAQR